MLTSARHLVSTVRMRLGSDLVSGWFVVVHTYLYYFVILTLANEK